MKIRRARVVTLAPTGRVAMIERYVRGRRFLSVPGGRMERGETPEQAALREIEEELGLRITLAGRLPDAEGQAYFLAVVPEEAELRMTGPEARHAGRNNRYTPRWVDALTLEGLPLRQPVRPLVTTAALTVAATMAAARAAQAAAENAAQAARIAAEAAARKAQAAAEIAALAARVAAETTADPDVGVMAEGAAQTSAGTSVGATIGEAAEARAETTDEVSAANPPASEPVRLSERSQPRTLATSAAASVEVEPEPLTGPVIDLTVRVDPHESTDLPLPGPRAEADPAAATFAFRHLLRRRFTLPTRERPADSRRAERMAARR